MILRLDLVWTIISHIVYSDKRGKARITSNIMTGAQNRLLAYNKVNKQVFCYQCCDVSYSALYTVQSVCRGIYGSRFIERVYIMDILTLESLCKQQLFSLYVWNHAISMLLIAISHLLL